jgi:hypothetical protein
MFEVIIGSSCTGRRSEIYAAAVEALRKKWVKRG